MFQVIKSKDMQLRLLYPASLLFKIEGEIKSFPDKRRLKAYINTKPAKAPKGAKGPAVKRRRSRERLREGERNTGTE